MAAADIFNQIAESTDKKFGIRVSFVEIYNENIKDLLFDGSSSKQQAAASDKKEGDKKKKKERTEMIDIREDPIKGVYIDTTEIVIQEFDDIMKAVKKGISRRTVEATQMNEVSSRSHSIFK